MSCDHGKGEVLETRRHGGSIYRRRKCHLCGLRYVTVENIHAGSMPTPMAERAARRSRVPEVVEVLRQDQRMADGAAALAAVFK